MNVLNLTAKKIAKKIAKKADEGARFEEVSGTTQSTI